MNKTIRFTAILIINLFFLVACGNAAELYPKLWGAASTGKLQKVEALIDKGLDVNKRDLSGGTALIHASLGGHTEVVRLLLRHGAKVNIRDRSMGVTALSGAASNGHKATVLALLAAGAKDYKGAIHWAKKYHRSEMVELLREKSK